MDGAAAASTLDANAVAVENSGAPPSSKHGRSSRKIIFIVTFERAGPPRLKV
jgi:hypothetical protein